MAFIVVDGVSERKKVFTSCGGTRNQVKFFFFGKCYSHLHNRKAFVHMGERSVGQRVCAKLTESFRDRGTIDDLTEKQCCLSHRAC